MKAGSIELKTSYVLAVLLGTVLVGIVVRAKRTGQRSLKAPTAPSSSACAAAANDGRNGGNQRSQRRGLERNIEEMPATDCGSRRPSGR